MKKILAVILSLIMVLSLAACAGNSAPAADPVTPAEESKPVQESESVQEEQPAPEPAPDPAQDENSFTVENDDSHYVVTVNGVTLSYEYAGDVITGLEGYVDCGSAADALLAVSQYVEGSDPTVKDVYAKGKYCVISYTEEAWQGLDVSSLKLLYDYINQ